MCRSYRRSRDGHNGVKQPSRTPQGRDIAFGPAKLDELDGRWPGLRDRLCEPGPALRRHFHVYVDRERAALDTPIEDRSHVNVVAAISGG